ncbi:DUF1934 domain-containing protein [Lachnospiraceae bacterium]|jgi:uncharacterized beta-barrel protein YwiB (DUF1934 family)|nr:DUF1934 domain-containing protein [Lachnospiraceae bacterium]
MTKEIILSIKGLQTGVDEDAQGTEVIALADYYKKNDSHYVIYEELTEGFSETTRSRIKFNDSCMEVSKKGLINVHMIFDKNKKNMTSYVTPYGNIFIGIDTESILVKEEENRIKVEVYYALEANYQHLANCRIEMQLAPREDGIRLA